MTMADELGGEIAQRIEAVFSKETVVVSSGKLVILYFGVILTVGFTLNGLIVAILRAVCKAVFNIEEQPDILDVLGVGAYAAGGIVGSSYVVKNMGDYHLLNEAIKIRFENIMKEKNISSKYEVCCIIVENGINCKLRRGVDANMGKN